MPADAGLAATLATVLAALTAKSKTWGKLPCQGVAAAESLSLSLPSEVLRLRCEPLEDDFVLDSCLSSACPGASWDTRELFLGAGLSWVAAGAAASLLAKSAKCSEALALSAWMASLVAAKLCR